MMNASPFSDLSGDLDSLVRNMGSEPCLADLVSTVAAGAGAAAAVFSPLFLANLEGGMDEPYCSLTLARSIVESLV
ncbi:hypothetical protein ACHAWO_013251 [Cyclotella atomus]|uniref:Uncharacterized protein n=1 Tax=Cyclotella atomus TaxID=382360 RepID=A0ABD3QJT1_9STRA